MQNIVIAESTILNISKIGAYHYHPIFELENMFLWIFRDNISAEWQSTGILAVALKPYFCTWLSVSKPGQNELNFIRLVVDTREIVMNNDWLTDWTSLFRHFWKVQNKGFESMQKVMVK